MTDAKPPTPKGYAPEVKTKPRSIKVSDELWTAARAKAESEGFAISDVIRDFLMTYVGDPTLSPVAGSEMDRRSGQGRARLDSSTSEELR